MTLSIQYRYRVRVDLVAGRQTRPLATLWIETTLDPEAYSEAVRLATPGVMIGSVLDGPPAAPKAPPAAEQRVPPRPAKSQGGQAKKENRRGKKA